MDSRCGYGGLRRLGRHNGTILRAKAFRGSVISWYAWTTSKALRVGFRLLEKHTHCDSMIRRDKFWSNMCGQKLRKTILNLIYDFGVREWWMSEFTKMTGNFRWVIDIHDRKHPSMLVRRTTVTLPQNPPASLGRVLKLAQKQIQTMLWWMSCLVF